VLLISDSAAVLKYHNQHIKILERSNSSRKFRRTKADRGHWRTRITEWPDNVEVTVEREVYRPEA
jgi:hypothetical protein